MPTSTRKIVSVLAVSGALLAGSNGVLFAQGANADAIRSDCIAKAMKSWPDTQTLDHQRARTLEYADCMRANGLRP